MQWPKMHVMSVGDPDRASFVEAIMSGWPGETCLHEDLERQGVLWNHRTISRCMVGDSHRWSLVVQDDVEMLPGALEHLEQVMHYAPHPFVSLSHFATNGEKALAKGAAFAESVHAMWGQANLYGKKIRQAYARYVDDIWEMDAEAYRKWDDGIPAAFNLAYGTKSCITTRALFQHADVKSVLGHNLGHWRHAHATIEQPGPAWNARTVSLGSGARDEHKELARKVQAWRSR